MDPVVVTIPHRHGKTEATRRIRGTEDVRAHYPAQLKIAEENWEGDRLRFRAAVLCQTITGAIDVAADEVRTEAMLTWLMGHLVKPAEALIKHEGELILNGP
jgi:hypothetical protein